MCLCVRECIYVCVCVRVCICVGPCFSVSFRPFVVNTYVLICVHTEKWESTCMCACACLLKFQPCVCALSARVAFPRARTITINYVTTNTAPMSELSTSPNDHSSKVHSRTGQCFTNLATPFNKTINPCLYSTLTTPLAIVPRLVWVVKQVSSVLDQRQGTKTTSSTVLKAI